jgi:calcium-dependent protein kinase
MEKGNEDILKKTPGNDEDEEKKRRKKKKKDDKKKKKKKKKKGDEDDSEDEEKSDEEKKKDGKEKQDIICDNYVMLMEMGKGAFGQIYLTYNIQDQEEVATKKEIKKIGKTTAPQLKMEFIIYKTLLHIVTPAQNDFQIDFSGKVRIPQEEVQGVPKFYGYGECTEYHYLIMQLLGPNLVELFNFCGNRKFTISTVCMVAIQMLNRIEYFHKNHYVHRDIKPENFVIGCGEKSNIIYLIDFGLCKKYKDPKTHQHIPYREGRLLTGTARYVSINTHLGIEQSRRDDLESIGYVLVFFLKGSLPWQGLKTNIDKYNKIMEKKLQIPTEILCYGLPDELAYYLNYCKSLRFEDRPDYDYLRGLFVKLLYSCINVYSLQKEHMKFDWCFEDPNTIWALYNRKKLPQKKKDQNVSASNDKGDKNDETPGNSNITPGETKPKEITSKDLQNLMNNIEGYNLQNNPTFNNFDEVLLDNNNPEYNDQPNENVIVEAPIDLANQEDIYPGVNKDDYHLGGNTPEGNFEKTNENNPDYANVSEFDNISHNMTKEENLTVGNIKTESNNNLNADNISVKSDETVVMEANPSLTNLTKMSDKEMAELHKDAGQEDIDIYVNRLIIKSKRKSKSNVKRGSKDSTNIEDPKFGSGANNNANNILSTSANNPILSEKKDSYAVEANSQKFNSKVVEDTNIDVKPNNKNFININQFINDHSESGESSKNVTKYNSKTSTSGVVNANPSGVTNYSSKKEEANSVNTANSANNTQANPQSRKNSQSPNRGMKSFERQSTAIITNSKKEEVKLQRQASINNVESKSKMKNDPKQGGDLAQQIEASAKKQPNVNKVFQEPEPNNSMLIGSGPKANNTALTFKATDEEKKDLKSPTKPPVSIEQSIQQKGGKKDGTPVKDSSQNIININSNSSKLAVESSNKNLQTQKSIEKNIIEKTNERSQERRKTKLESVAKHAPSNIKLNKDNMIKISNEPIQKYYSIMGDLGHGSYGSVKKVKHKQLGEERAMKIVQKKSESSQNEIEILKKISHPNIISIYEIFEDSKNYYIMTELMSGGELFEVITNQGSFSEVDAAKIIKQILNSVNYLHNKNIVHRDLKPENILMNNKSTVKDQNYDIKIIDFGTAKQFERNQKLSKFIGTSYYIAPEVLAECYDEKCDVWSCGVILYILLCGYPPFNGASNIDIYHAIKYNAPNFSGEEWRYVHKDAIDLIKNMLNKNPLKRYSCEQVLNHKWFRNMEEEAQNMKNSKKNSSAIQTGMNAINKMKDFVVQNKLKQAVLQYICTQFNLKEEEENMRDLFSQFDTHKKGVINIADFTQILIRLFGENDGKANAEQIFNNIDLDGSGEISYNEFITALIEGKNLVTNDRLQKAFKMLDRDGSGSISLEEIRHVFGGEESKWRRIVNEVDLNGDGEIDFAEFKKMMKGIEQNEVNI